MIYTTIKGKQVSKLAFGTMRLPLLEDKTIDQKQVEEMVKLAIEAGVNYFDTAWPYHGGLSEIAISKALSKYPRESYFVADKYPGHQIAEKYNPQEIFEKQLEKTNFEYFDFYLLHNVYENDIDVYEDPKWGIIDYFVEQKRLGRIKNLGFSSHAKPETLRRFLDSHPGLFDFCQIQLNYLDYDLQDAKTKVDILNERNIPIMVMEPVRGSKLANFEEEDNNKMKAMRPDCSIASWAFNWLLNIKGVSVILSGMSNVEQMKDNIKTFTENKPLNEQETKLVYDIVKPLLQVVPCTKCRYCCDGCPMGLDIPTLINTYNELKVSKSFNATMYLDAISEDKWPSACIECGACKNICPQNIDVPSVLEDLTNTINSMTSWKEICKQREEENKRNAGK